MSTLFGKQLGKANDTNTYLRVFPFRESEIGVLFQMGTSGNIEHVRIGDTSDRKVELTKIGQYGQLLIEIQKFIEQYHTHIQP